MPRTTAPALGLGGGGTLPGVSHNTAPSPGRLESVPASPREEPVLLGVAAVSLAYDSGQESLPDALPSHGGVCSQW